MDRHCPPNTLCDRGMCVTNTQCYSDAQCEVGSKCTSQGHCAYTKAPMCSRSKPCLNPYICDMRTGQCVMPPPAFKCPNGFSSAGYWCVRNAEPECGYTKGLCRESSTKTCIEVSMVGSILILLLSYLSICVKLDKFSMPVMNRFSIYSFFQTGHV